MMLATLCYLRKDGKTLMLHRSRNKEDMHLGNYVAPGGKVESGESPEECIVRELREETGLTPLNLMLKGILTFSNEGRVFGNEGKQEDWYVIVYTSNDFRGELKQPKEGSLEWVADEEINKLPMWEGDRIFTEWIGKPGVFSAKFTYRDKKLEGHKVVFYD